jgi:hypothetical protein
MSKSEVVHPKFKRTCAACGRRALMNKEHVWPQWLIRKTATKGVRFTEDKKINPYGMTVPLCKSCNSAFGDQLETPVSKILPALEAGEGLTDREAEILVRWLWKFEGLFWIFDHPNDQYSPIYTLRERVLQPLDAIRGELTLAVSIIAQINPAYDDEPMGVDSNNKLSGIFVAAVFGRVAMMVLQSKFEPEVPPEFSLYRFASPDSPDRDAKLLFPKTGFADCEQAVFITRTAAPWLSHYHDVEAEREQEKQRG